jgi:predicted transposase YbfD/YdcC
MKKLMPIKRTPVRIEILSSAENTSLLHNDLNNILVDASGCCEYMGYVDHNGDMRVKIECIVSEEEKEHSWDQLRLKHVTDCYISVEPNELPIEPIIDFND